MSLGGLGGGSAATGTTLTPSISKMFVFDTRLGPTEETEQEKILFYFPASTSISQQMSDVGLAEGIINFSRTFQPDKPVHAMHTQKCRQVFIQPEQDVWFSLAVRNPRTTGRDGDTFHEEEMDDSLLLLMLEEAHKLFCLFNGRMSEVVRSVGVEGLRQKLSLLLPSYIASSTPVQKLDITYALGGIRYFPVDRLTFLSLQSFFHLTQHDFRSLRAGLCLFDDLLVWSSLSTHSDTSAIYSYIVRQVVKQGGQVEESLSSLRRTRLLPPAKDPDAPPIFAPYNKVWVLPLALSGYSTLQLGAVAGKIPLVYLDGGSHVCHLVVFRHEKLTWAFLLDESEAIGGSFLPHFSGFISNQVHAFEQTLSNLDSRVHQSDEPYRYLYFNHMNLALKDSLSGKGTTLSQEIQAILLEMHATLTGGTEEVAARNHPPGDANDGAQAGEDVHASAAAAGERGDEGAEGGGRRKEITGGTTEICVKTVTDGWVVGRISNGRELYVISENKTSNLVEVSDEVHRISSSYFSNIFI